MRNIYIYDKNPIMKQRQQTNYFATCSLRLNQLIWSPVYIACSTFSILDRILGRSSKKNFQYGVIDVGFSDHQLTYGTSEVSGATHAPFPFIKD